MLTEVVRFPTSFGNERAFADQKAWIERAAKDLGFTYADRGKVVEIELPGPPGAPVLGLAVHGDVVPADGQWTFPAFEAAVSHGRVQGRGVVDDKGPLVQALLAMKALEQSGRARTHTIRLLVGSDEERGSSDFREYLPLHRAPDLTLVLDSSFPVVVGEMASNGFYVETKLEDRRLGLLRATSLGAGIAGNIVPDTASARIDAMAGTPGALALTELRKRIEAVSPPAGVRIEIEQAGLSLIVLARGKAAHAGVNPAGGRNALVALAGILEAELPPGGARDLLAFARIAGQDLHGTALGLVENDPLFGRAIAVPTMIRAVEGDKVRLQVNVRASPALWGEALKARLLARVREFNERTGANLEAGGTFRSQPFVIDRDAKLVKRLVAAYRRATGRDDAPGVSAGGTYAQVIPNSIPFGMWFPGKPYPGHDVDEQVAIADLHLGARALIEAITDLACGEPLEDPLKP
jgi:succinyl-diaminopimelate desuccinylase